MKNFLLSFEELWVSIAFAEAGRYECYSEGLHVQSRSVETVHLHAV